jgi:hypothetical protein
MVVDTGGSDASGHHVMPTFSLVQESFKMYKFAPRHIVAYLQKNHGPMAPL